VLKLANATEERSMLEAQNAAMAHLSAHIDLCPRVLPAKNGEDILPVESPKGERHFTRLVTYLPGTPLGDVKRRSPVLLHDLGTKVGLVDVALQGFDHPALHRDFHWDLANGLKIIRQNGDLITDAQLRDWVKAFAENFENNLAPLLRGCAPASSTTTPTTTTSWSAAARTCTPTISPLWG
jgi:Ser/Thr protein kinase RdoA (MazF antagonist)